MALTMSLEEIQALCRAHTAEQAKNGLDKEKLAALCQTIQEWLASGGKLPDYSPKKSDIPPWIVG